MDQVTGRLEKPRQSWAGLWNISFGFFGIQIGFALQNANMSRIFQSLGESLDDLALLWIAGVAVAMLAVILGVAPIRSLFHFGALHLDDLALVAGVVATVVAGLESLKRLWRVRLAG